MPGHDIFYALVLPGIGDADWGYTGYGANWAKDYPVALYTGTIPSGVNTYVFFDALDVGVDGKKGSADHIPFKINPIEGVVEVGEVTFDLVADEAGIEPQDPNLERYFHPGKTFSRRIKEADGLLNENITAVSSTIKLWSRSGSAFAAGDTIYLEDETILLTNLDSATGSEQTFDCYRGAYGSTARAHQTTPGTGTPEGTIGYDNRVYLNPSMRNRYIEVIQYDGSTTEVVFAGYLIPSPETDRGTSILRVKARDIFTSFMARTLNKEPHGSEWGGEYIGTKERVVITDNTLTGNNINQRYGPAIRGGARTILSIGDSLVSAVSDSDGNYSVSKNPLGDDQSTILLDTPVFKIPENADDDLPIAEVVAAGTALTDVTGENYGSVFGTYPFHPWFLWTCMVLSTGRGDNNATYDQLSSRVGLGIPEDRVDVAGIETLLSEWSDLEMHAVVFGYKGADWSTQDMRARLLTPWLAYPRISSGYKIGLKVLEPVTSADVDHTISDATIEMLSEGQVFGWEESIQTLGATAKQPWQDKARKIISQDLGQGVPPWDPSPLESRFELDLSGFPPIDIEGNGRAREAVDAVLEWMRRPIPTYTLRVPLHVFSSRPFAGDTINIVSSGYRHFWDASGDKESSTEDILGLITSVKHSFEEASYELEVWGVNDPLIEAPRKIPPAFYVNAAASTGGTALSVQVDKERYGVDLETIASGLVGETLELWDSTGLQKSNLTISSVVSVDASNFDLDLTAAASGITVAVGDILRLSDYATNEVTDYVYMADENELLSDGEPGNRYI